MAILGTNVFDVTTVDLTTLTFGPSSASPAHDLTDPYVYTEHLQDVNMDTFLDLVSHYRCSETGIAEGDTEACLAGSTTTDSNCLEARSEETGCDDQACEDTVCAGDPFCCEEEWDSLCVDEANAWCNFSVPFTSCDSVRTVPKEKD